MIMKKLLFYCLWSISGYTWAQNLPVTFQKSEQDLIIKVGDRPFAKYLSDADHRLKKPVLFDIHSPGGHSITRGWPLEPREGERTDHPHHVGMWLNHGDVNGIDFWNNSTARDSTNPYGTIIQQSYKKIKAGKKQGTLTITADWVNNKGEVLLKETTTYLFSGTVKERVIDRKTTLKAARDVLLADNKEGLFAIRLAKELEHPDPKMSYVGTGEYQNDFGTKGKEVWGKRSEWMILRGRIANEEMTLIMLDHPSNPNAPAHWHARDYGLFAVNNIGAEVFTKGEEFSDIDLFAGQKITFRFRLIIADKHLSEPQVRNYAHEYY